MSQSTMQQFQGILTEADHPGTVPGAATTTTTEDMTGVTEGVTDVTVTAMTDTTSTMTATDVPLVLMATTDL